MTTDEFGIQQIYSTKSGGREYVSNWHNGTAREYYSTSTHETDPEMCFLGNTGTYNISGNGTLTGDPTNSIGTMCMYGIAPRVYIRSSNGIANTTHGYGSELELTPWGSCEITAYTLYTRLDCFQSYSGITFGWGTNHLPDSTDDSNFGDYSSRTLYGQIQGGTGACYLKKELYFPATISEVSTISRFPFNGPSPIDEWIGVKTIIREYSNVLKNKVEIYIDRTNGVDGGTWTRVLNHTDYQGWSSSFAPIQWFSELAHNTDADYSAFTYSLVNLGSASTITGGYLTIFGGIETYEDALWRIDCPVNGTINCNYAPTEIIPSYEIQLFGFRNFTEYDNTNKLYLYIDTSSNICLKVYNNLGNEIIDVILISQTFAVGNVYNIELNFDDNNQYLYVNQLLKSHTEYDISGKSGGCEYIFSSSTGSDYKIGRLAVHNSVKHTEASYPSKENVYDVPQIAIENDTITGQPIKGGFWYGSPMCAQYLGKAPIGASTSSPAQCNYSTFIRNDYTNPVYGAQYFKWYSVREIDDLIELPTIRSQKNCNNLIDRW